MPEKHKRHSIREKEARIILDKASKELKLDLEHIFRDATVFEILEAVPRIFLINRKPVLFENEGRVYPTLVFEEFLASAPEIVVDMGAVPYVCKGADIMAPGIVGHRRAFKTGDFVLIIDERHRKTLAIGKALFDSEEVKSVKRGVVVKNIHFVSDRIWQLFKNLIRE